MASEKDVVFTGDLARRPKAHIPGQAAERVEGQILAVEGPEAPISVGRPLTTEPMVRAKGYVYFKRLHDDAVMPALGSAGAAGYDLTTPAAVKLKAGERTTIPLGFALEIPDFLHGRIESRSGLALKGLVVLTGVVDSDYRGEIKVIIQNFSGEAYEFAAGDRVAQLVLRPTIHVPFAASEQLSSSSRDEGGFGSTGR